MSLPTALKYPGKRMTHDILDYVRLTKELLDAEQSFVTVTLLDIRGSAPQVKGAKALVTDQGIVGGTVGGGKIEAAAIQFGQQLIARNDSNTELVTWNLQTDVGMTCGGEVKLFFEVHRKAAWPIAIFGAGHVAQALIPILSQLNCRITCVDSRSEWLAKLDDHPKLSKRCLESPADIVETLDPETFFALMSKGHSADMPVLTKILETREPPYLGVIGSAQKASVLKRDLKKAGLSDDKINRFRCPIGLPLGNNTTAEIAISIAAQLIQVRDELGIFEHKRKDF